jgi:AraC-like DNA-binding protein
VPFPNEAPGSVRAELGRFVESVVWAQTREGALYPMEHLPDGGVALLFRLVRQGQGHLSISGPRSKARFKLAPGMPLYVRVRFRPGTAAPFLGVPASEVLDRVLPLEHLWGNSAGDLAEQVAATAEPERVVERIQDALVQRLRTNDLFEPAGARAARKAVRLLEHPDRMDAAVSVEELSGVVGLSERHFRRAFTEAVGMSPKAYARVMRLHRALRAPGDWSQRALASGYYDQAHLACDFREMLGTTPTAFAAARSLPRTVCGSEAHRLPQAG